MTKLELKKEITIEGNNVELKLSFWGMDIYTRTDEDAPGDETLYYVLGGVVIGKSQNGEHIVNSEA